MLLSNKKNGRSRIQKKYCWGEIFIFFCYMYRKIQYVPDLMGNTVVFCFMDLMAGVLPFRSENNYCYDSFQLIVQRITKNS